MRSEAGERKTVNVTLRRHEFVAYPARNRGNRDRVIGLVGIGAIVLGTAGNDVSQGIIPAKDLRRPLSKHPVGIEWSVRRYTVSQDEHQGEGAKECEDKFP